MIAERRMGQVRRAAVFLFAAFAVAAWDPPRPVTAGGIDAALPL